jgi:inhibitor of KinA sporulation pathway (predicted exonuclease)
MNIISIDLEMNKPSNKIIEVGFCIVNVKKEQILTQQKIYIHPGEKLSPEIVELTGITDELLEKEGVASLEVAYNQMVHWCNKLQTHKHPVQWGTDHYELKKQLGIDWENYIFSRRGIDVKALYQTYMMCAPQGKTVAGLRKALQSLGEEFQGRQHDAMDDAINTWHVMRLLQRKFKLADSITKAHAEYNKKD